MQLMDLRWFPATLFRPSTSFTFRFLDFFRALQDRSKCTSYDFYHTVLQCTDSAGLEPEIVSTRVFLFLDVKLTLRSIDTMRSASSFAFGATSNS